MNISKQINNWAKIVESQQNIDETKKWDDKWLDSEITVPQLLEEYLYNTNSIVHLVDAPTKGKNIDIKCKAKEAEREFWDKFGNECDWYDTKVWKFLVEEDGSLKIFLLTNDGDDGTPDMMDM